MKLHMSFPTDVKVMLLLVFLYGMTWLIVTWFRRRSAVTWMQKLSERLDMREWDDEMVAHLLGADETLWEDPRDTFGGSTDQEGSQ